MLVQLVALDKENLPVGHGVQEEYPVVGAKVSALHTAATDKPETPQAEPAGHGEQVEYPLAGANVPDGHGEQMEYPVVGAWVPALHAVATDNPETPQADPAGHGAQAENPVDDDNVPTGQGSGSALPNNVPFRLSAAKLLTTSLALKMTEYTCTAISLALV
jgi:hypothetical protein